MENNLNPDPKLLALVRFHLDSWTLLTSHKKQILTQEICWLVIQLNFCESFNWAAAYFYVECFTEEFMRKKERRIEFDADVSENDFC